MKMNAMTKFFFAAMLLIYNQGKSQKDSSNIGIGLNISQYQKDFGVGIHLLSPYFIKSIVAIKVGANIQWLESFNGTETTWVEYKNFQLGLRGRRGVVTDKIFLYGEGGVVIILPGTEFSSKKLVPGGYGLFGFEFKPAQKFAYYIELGGIGTGAFADKIIGKPIYSNGFLTNVGFRIFL